MTSTTGAGHDIEPYPVKSNGAASARCRTHDTSTAEHWGTLSAAVREFRCDEGRGLRFIIENRLDDPPSVSMRDLTGLTRVVYGDAEARIYGSEAPDTRVWLWLGGGLDVGGGNLEPLTVSLQHSTGFDEDNFSYETWQVTGVDGRVITTAGIRVDGRV